MLLRNRSSLFFATGVLCILWLLLTNHRRIVSHVVEQYKGAMETEVVKAPGFEEVPTIQIIDPLVAEVPKPQEDLFPAPPRPPLPEMTLLEATAKSSRITLHLSIQFPEATTTSSSASSTATWSLQDEFIKENSALGKEQNAGQIYGNTLDGVIGVGLHAESHTLSLKETNTWKPYARSKPLEYHPYPDYNSEVWKSKNKGTYVPCDGGDGPIKDILTFSGHSKAFEEPQMGSYSLFDIDSNLCFERETRLGSYGYTENSGVSINPDSPPGTAKDKRNMQTSIRWDEVNWGLLQTQCFEKNRNRYLVSEIPEGLGGEIIIPAQNASSPWNDSKAKQLNTKKRVLGTIVSRNEGEENEIKDHFVKAQLEKAAKVALDAKTPYKSRTAIMLRSYSGKKWNENDKQNVRSIITELSLKSGGEFEVFLLVHIRNSTIAIGNDADYIEALHKNVPKEFHDIAVLWNEDYVQGYYPLIPKKVTNVHQSQWLPVQIFALDYPQFDFYWNWEMDTRYTGHHYGLVEKLTKFGTDQPRKYLWERNERYYIPSVHGSYDTDFRKTVEILSGKDTIWAPPNVSNVVPTGPLPPVSDPAEDNYEWGVGESADYISVAPMFNPNGTGWVGKNDVWGYDGRNDTPRRTTIITHSRCSKKLLDAMHTENLNGNHVSSEMTPQTVALLHGLKAVYAPLPIFFDRAWNGTSLNKWFNPGPKEESGSSSDSPFGWGKEKRFLGMTWYYRAIPPARLYNNWMGWEDHGMGGAEWENLYGRPCLPPLLLHPVKNTEKSKKGFATKYDFP
ncbi:4f531d3f-95fc-43ed-928e-7ef5b50b45b5 [Sclerotinia trifoliorum]|uniref:4f531d3f-95fc-43ed-928e-7ef5b50b45b5 n=1 Tax=Sclerotinia trifoliorum TaxID=28548 RepID=A0A8H2VMR6_9HELO|nr:4f531d3f-95fc-43ed-928e-7ef5b50b45b5 [Sclerotinia trifoliorum]